MKGFECLLHIKYTHLQIYQKDSYAYIFFKYNLLNAVCSDDRKLLNLHSSNACSSPLSLSLNTETITGSGSGSVWQAYRGIGWAESKTCLCSSARSWNLRKWMELKTRQERGAQLSLEPTTCVCLSQCINQSAAAAYVYPVNLISLWGSPLMSIIAVVKWRNTTNAHMQIPNVTCTNVCALHV